MDNETHGDNVVTYVQPTWQWLQDIEHRLGWCYEAFVWTPVGTAWVRMVPGCN